GEWPVDGDTTAPRDTESGLPPLSRARRRDDLSRPAIVVASSIAALVLIGAGVYVARNPERKTLDATARAGAAGKVVRLSDGVTEYDLSGADTGRAVVLLSGAT